MLLLLVATAFAQEPAPPPAAWAWPEGTPVLYHLETQLLTPRTVRYYASENLDVLAVGLQVGADATCSSKPQGKNWLVSCDLTWFKAAGRASAADEQAKLDRIMDEWSRDLTGARVEWVQTKEGRLREFDLFRAQQKTRTEGYIIESQRMALQRMFCLFDLPLPKAQDDWKRGWKQKESATMQLAVISGTVGASEIQHSRKADKWDYLTVDTVGRGTLAPGGAVDSTGTKLIDVRIGGEALFDPKAGLPVYRDLTLDGRLTVSSHQVGSDAEFFQASAIQRVEAFGKDGEPPLSIPAQRAPKVDLVAPALPDGVSLVPFADLGMQAFYVQGHPDGAKVLSLPTVKVRARVVIGADGAPTSVTVTQGFQVLATPTQSALERARFPARPAPYAVDVDVEWRP